MGSGIFSKLREIKILLFLQETKTRPHSGVLWSSYGCPERPAEIRGPRL